MRRAAFAVLLLAAATAAADDCTPLKLDPVPATILWRVPAINFVFTDDDITLLESATCLQRVDPLDGRVLWSRDLPNELYAPHIVLLPDAIAVAHAERFVTILDRGTGERRALVDVGEWMRFLDGPPLLAVTQATDATVSTLVRLSNDGRILARRVVPLATNLVIADDVAAIVSQFEHTPDTLTGYDLFTLEPLWQEKSHTFNTQILDGRLYVGDIFWSEGAKAIDPRTGTGPLVPPRDPSQIGGSGEFDLQVTDTAWEGSWEPNFGTCSRLRRNDAATGRTVWAAQLPFDVTATLRDGKHLFVAGSRTKTEGYAVRLDWATGEVVQAWSGLPLITKLKKTGDVILGWEYVSELVAFSAE